jgi:hypothetical protein
MICKSSERPVGLHQGPGENLTRVALGWFVTIDFILLSGFHFQVRVVWAAMSPPKAGQDAPDNVGDCKTVPHVFDVTCMSLSIDLIRDGFNDAL